MRKCFIITLVSTYVAAMAMLASGFVICMDEHAEHAELAIAHTAMDHASEHHDEDECRDRQFIEVHLLSDQSDLAFAKHLNVLPNPISSFSTLQITTQVDLTTPRIHHFHKLYHPYLTHSNIIVNRT